LGWLYREKGVPLAEISLSKLVPFVWLRFQMKEFASEDIPIINRLKVFYKDVENGKKNN
jgi:hypothetical protein